MHCVKSHVSSWLSAPFALNFIRLFWRFIFGILLLKLG